jgi:hypothetical protein
MGIEPMRAAPQSLKNAAYRDAATAACDWRARPTIRDDGDGTPLCSQQHNVPLIFQNTCIR